MEDCGFYSFFVFISGIRFWIVLFSVSVFGTGGRIFVGISVFEFFVSFFDDYLVCKEESCCEELDGCVLDEGCGRRGESVTVWRDRRVIENSFCFLDGELDIE